MASSSSSSSTCVRNYDVFLSFRGKDTRKNIASFLYHALRNDGIVTFRDDRRLQTGDNISNQLIEAIKTSWFAVVVISENYATSKWCLEELRLIMELHSENRIKVVPVFYEVEPTHVRHQTGSFAPALQKHKERGATPDRVFQWKRALYEVSNLSGFNSQTSLDEATMISNVVQSISSQLLDMRQPSGVNLVGVEAHMVKMHFLTKIGSENEVLRIGIWGMGGVGKTTIAKCLYDQFSRDFPARYFIEDIKKIYKGKSPSDLQKRFLFSILGEHIGTQSGELGPQEIKARLGHRKVLLVLDGVDKAEQIHALAKETTWFGPGSRIIITTRDRGLLYSSGVYNVHEVKCLGDKDALQIFQNLAFGGLPPPSDGFEKLFIRASQLAHGLPSALVAYASHLSENKTIQSWEDELHILETRPHQNVQQILRNSYDNLDEQDKTAFLHVACLFNGYPVSQVASLLDAGCPRINHLITKSLVSISADRCINMHFLVVLTGRAIVRQESSDKPFVQRFLWDHKEICDVLGDNIGTNKTEGVTLHMCEMTDKLPLCSKVFDDMHSIAFLKFFQHLRDAKSSVQLMKDGLKFPPALRLLHWDAYPLKTLTLSQHNNLVQLELRYSKLKSLWNRPVNLRNLRRLDVTGSKKLIALTDFSTAKNLEELIVEGCMKLQRIPESLMSLVRLTKLNIVQCNILSNVKFSVDVIGNGRRSSTTLTFPGHQGVTFKFLTDLSIEGQMHIDLLGLHGNAEHLSFGSKHQIITEEMMTMEQETEMPVKSLEIRRFSYMKDGNPFRCDNLRTFSFPCLRELKLINLNIQAIPKNISDLQFLEKLDLSGNDFRKLPTTMGELAKLKYLSLAKCHKLEVLPQLSQVETLILSYCANLGSFLDFDVEESLNTYCLTELWLDNCNKIDFLTYQLHRLTKLTYLDLSRNDFLSIPGSIRELSSLGTLFLNNCKKLKSVEQLQLPQSIKHLYAHGCDSLERVTLSPNHSIKHLDLNHCPLLKREEHEHLMDLCQKVSRRSVSLPETGESSGSDHRSTGASTKINRSIKLFRSLTSVFTKGFSRLP